jgi:hypothetical protein
VTDNRKSAPENEAKEDKKEDKGGHEETGAYNEKPK